MTDRPIDPNDITPEMVEQVEDLLKRQEWNCDEHRDVIAAILTCARRWKLGPAEDRVTLGDVGRFVDLDDLLWLRKNDEIKIELVRYHGGREVSWPSVEAFAAEVAAWKEGQR